MNGKILAYSAEVGAGLISCDSNQRYIFYAREWTLNVPPVNDMLVEFEAGSEQALKVKAVTQ